MHLLLYFEIYFILLTVNAGLTLLYLGRLPILGKEGQIPYLTLKLEIVKSSDVIKKDLIWSDNFTLLR